jgi:hypothetical protein
MRYITTAICAFVAFMALAQHGPRIGIGLATRGPGVFGGSKADMLPGPLFGWHFEAPLHPQVSLMPELLWMTKGALVRVPAQGLSTVFTLRYIEVPLVLKISTDRKPNGLFILAGPGLGWFVRGREQRFLNGQLTFDEPVALADNERRSQFSVTLGFGMEGQRWGFDARGQSSTGLLDPVVRPQNQVYMLTVYFRFNNPKPQSTNDKEKLED